ncbi:MAG: methyltransferase domain-containing protein [candidate division NC10 bacterium]|nr:methyltransferase domain-containing protein [candidate division NC10 bacterium]
MVEWKEARRIIGIDHSAEAIVRARDRALALGLDHATFVCCDAENIDYRDLGPIDLVVANLCMSDEILRRAAAVLEPGRFIAFAAFHQDQWKESGKASRYAYAEGQLETALLEAGFEPVYLGVEQEVVHFADQDEALSYLESAGIAGKWKTDGRWDGFLIYLESRARDLTTKAHVIVKAQRR